MKSACFTGHRNINENTEILYNVLEYYIKNHGLTDFYAGGAVGWDTLAEFTVLKLKKIYPHIRLHLVLPCSNKEQTAKWSAEQQKNFCTILSLADTTEYTSENYCAECMKIRNKKLVEYADICFCYMNTNNRRSGTAQTVNISAEKNISIINFFQKTLDKREIMMYNRDNIQML